MRSYTRTVSGWWWWKRGAFYRWYMLRELSSVFITAYALVLLWGLATLVGGQAAYQGWLQTMASPVAIAFHAVTLALVVYHAWTWFKIMPKTLAPLPVPDAAIVAAGMVAAALVTGILLWLA